MSTRPPIEPPPARSMPYCVKVFTIPELIHAIASRGALGRRDITRLSRTCRAAFSALVPLIWKEVVGVDILLGLIPGATFLYDEWTRKLMNVVLGQHPSPIQFDRFDFYAPFVTVLDIYHHKRPRFEVSGLTILLSRAQIRPLLPGLKTLRGMAEACAVDIPMWIRVFCQPSVQAVVIGSDNGALPTGGDWFLNPTPKSETLQALAECCPNLQRLSLCLKEALIVAVPPKPWYEYLEDLHNLRHVTVGEGWISAPALAALGKLAHLESLDLSPGNLQPELALNNLPQNSFPSLRTIGFPNIRALQHITPLCIRRLLANITSVEINHWAFVCMNAAWLEQDFLRLLLTATPSLRNLHITDAGSAFPSATDLSRNVGVPENLDLMASLPLETLVSDKMHIGTGQLNFNLNVIWSNVTVLTLPAQHASIQELAYFAAIPKLTRLVVKLDMTTTYTPQNIPNSNFAPLGYIASSQGSTLCNSSSAMMHNARILRQLWPRMVLIHWCPLDKQSEPFKNLARCFNGLISVQWRFEHPHLESYQKPGKDNKVRSATDEYDRLCQLIGTGGDPCGNGELYDIDERHWSSSDLSDGFDDDSDEDYNEDYGEV